MTLLIEDGCYAFTAWVQSGVPTIVAGRNGNGISMPAATQGVRYDIAGGSQTDTVTFGWAMNITAWPAGISTMANLNSDSNATNHDRVRVGSAGELIVARASTALITSAGGVLALNTWTYVEVSVKLHDTTGTATLKVNGTQIGSTFTGDTKNAGTKTVYDAVGFVGMGSGTNLVIDDVYIRNDATFMGDHAITDPNAGVNVKVWNGSSFVTAPLKVWSGSAFVSPTALKTYNGSTFV